MARPECSGSDKLTATLIRFLEALPITYGARVPEHNPDLSTLPEAQRHTYIGEIKRALGHRICALDIFIGYYHGFCVKVRG